MEVHAFTGLADAFTHVADGKSRVSDLPLSVCAVLLAQACNIGLKAVARLEVPALTLSRLSWMRQNYVRADTITAANARQVNAQDDLPLTRAWGGGEVASADGLRFVVPVRTIHAGWNSKYFGAQRGVTYYNFTSDQFTGFHGIVIPGTLRDSLYILAGLLEQQTRLDPREIMADTRGYSDVVFRLFALLGYKFSPRLADLPDQRFWRLDREADYGALNDLGRHTLNERLIAAHWEDMLRLAGSLKLGKVGATSVMRTLQRGGSLSSLGRAVAELGRIEKTLYLLNYVHDEAYRGRILRQLNRGEQRHSVARVVFHGHKGGTPPAVPGRHGRSTGCPRPGRECHRALEHPLPGCGPDGAATGWRTRAGRGRGPPDAPAARACEHAREIRFHPAGRDCPGSASTPA